MSEKTDYQAFEKGGGDQLWRQAMAGHRVEPKPALWKGISRKLFWRELIHFNFTNLSARHWVTGTVAMLLVATTAYFVYDYTVPEENVSQHITLNQGGLPVGNPDAKSIAGSLAGFDSKLAATPTEGSSARCSNKATLPSGKLYRHGQFAAAGETAAGEAAKPSTVPAQEPTSSGTGRLAANTKISRVTPFEATLPGLSAGTDTIITISNAEGINRIMKTGSETKRFFSASLGITPEISFYTTPDAYSKVNFWFDGVLTCHVSRFSLAAGIGLGYVYDEGNYSVEYKSLDSVGYYTAVTSYSVGNNNEIIFNTQTIGVYDSLYHSSDYRTKDRYTYLQVPLLLGYRLFESARASLTFQAGPAVSFLLDSRKSDPRVEYSNATIIRTDDDTPSRISTNWQVWADLYFEMRMNKQVSIYLEPSFKYYLKPMVEQENVTFKAPMTIGLGVGIQFNFGQKKTSP